MKGMQQDEQVNMKDFPSTTITTLDIGQLIKQNGDSVDVLFVEKSPCLMLKSYLKDKFCLKSDVYGSDQKFHITLGPGGKTKAPKIDVVAMSIYCNKCTFSVQSKLMPTHSVTFDTSTGDDEQADLNVRQANYFANLKKHIDTIIPTVKQHRWCLIFGQTVVCDFATEKEAIIYKQRSHLHMVVVAPKPRAMKEKDLGNK